MLRASTLNYEQTSKDNQIAQKFLKKDRDKKEKSTQKNKQMKLFLTDLDKKRYCIYETITRCH